MAQNRMAGNYAPTVGRFTQRDPHWNPENAIYGDKETETDETLLSKQAEREAVVFPERTERQTVYTAKDVVEYELSTAAYGYDCDSNGYEPQISESGIVELICPNTGAILQSSNLYVYCTNNPVMFVDPWGLEYVVISGSEHNTIFDRRYKYNFIEPAVKKLNELKSLQDNETITWLISATDYSEDDIANFSKTASEIGVNICFFKDSNELISYLNYKSFTSEDVSARSDDPIRKIAVFSHGLPGSIELGYHQKNQSELTLSIDDIQGIRKEAFDMPNSCFYSCNTATAGELGISFAQAWVNHVLGYTWAIYEKSDYGQINDWSNWSSIKKERAGTGYRPMGSDYYPIPSEKRNAYWVKLRAGR